jgi:hypothetical protein
MSRDARVLLCFLRQEYVGVYEGLPRSRVKILLESANHTGFILSVCQSTFYYTCFVNFLVFSGTS